MAIVSHQRSRSHGWHGRDLPVSVFGTTGTTHTHCSLGSRKTLISLSLTPGTAVRIASPSSAWFSDKVPPDTLVSRHMEKEQKFRVLTSSEWRSQGFWRSVVASSIGSTLENRCSSWSCSCQTLSVESRPCLKRCQPVYTAQQPGLGGSKSERYYFDAAGCGKARGAAKKSTKVRAQHMHEVASSWFP